MCIGDNPGLRALPYAISGAILAFSGLAFQLTKRKSLPVKFTKLVFIIASVLLLVRAYIELSTVYLRC